MKSIGIFALFIAWLATGVSIAEKFSKRVTTLEESYSNAAMKADNTRFYAIQKANTDRIKGFKSILTDATKAGDFETATAIKIKLEAAERESITRPKPRNVVKFGGHDYALIEEKATWHVAKKRCEEMGGHLVCVETPAEEAFVLSITARFSETFWVGATDEDTENEWRWVDGTPVKLAQMIVDNAQSAEHHLYCGRDPVSFGDFLGGRRMAFLCEWEK